MEPGKGYWILFNEPQQSYELTGLSILNYTILEAPAGWSMVGGCTFDARPAAGISDIGGIYRYDTETGYKRVHESDSMKPGEGFWILIEEVPDQCQIKVETASF